jgi:predicted TIM-barrel fold metal-dependent hydrolase
MGTSPVAMNDLILVSVDDHLIEPPDLYVRHMPERLKSRAPVCIRQNGRDVWQYNGKVYRINALNAVAGRPRSEYGMEPTSFDEMRKGCWDINARVDDMNANGVLGSLCFPSFPHFAGELFFKVDDKELALATVRAYNDWHVHEWCGTHPGRFIPLGILPIWDVSASVSELKRIVALGVHAISFPDNPSVHGLPSVHSDYWEPLWRACSDNRVVICCHIGTGLPAPHSSMETPIDAWITTMPISICYSAADWLHAPMWSRYPDLRMALSEGGIGWIPYFLERSDFTHEHHKAWTGADFGKLKPSEVFRRHIITCFIDDLFGLKNLDAVGEDMVMWECDYPHSDTLWPQCPEYLVAGFKDLSLSKQSIDKVTHLNAMREFSYDPFSVLGRGNCTVGALRQKATGVDTRPLVGLGGARPILDDNRHRVTSGDITRMFAQT